MYKCVRGAVTHMLAARTRCCIHGFTYCNFNFLIIHLLYVRRRLATAFFAHSSGPRVLTRVQCACVDVLIHFGGAWSGLAWCVCLPHFTPFLHRRLFVPIYFLFYLRYKLFLLFYCCSVELVIRTYISSTLGFFLYCVDSSICSLSRFFFSASYFSLPHIAALNALMKIRSSTTHST